MSKKQKYIPGVCNIGPGEIKRRRYLSFIGYFLFFLFLIGFELLNLPAPLRLSLFFPSFIQALGYLQAEYKFCAYFGIIGIYNIDKSVGNKDNVQQKFLQQDRNKALKIIFLSILIATLSAIAGFLTYYIDLEAIRDHFLTT